MISTSRGTSPARRLELLVGDDDVLATAEVDALDDPIGRHFLAGPLVDLLVTDPVRRALFELVEVDRLVLAVAGYRPTGTLTSPKLSEPDHTVRGGMAPMVPRRLANTPLSRD